MFERSPNPIPETPAGRNWWLWGGLALAALVVLAMTTGDSGCSSTGGTSGGSAQVDQGQMGKDLFDSATDTLDRLEQFETDPALRLVLERLNQWLEFDKPSGNWQVDPLLASLPDEPQGLRDIQAIETAGALRFAPDDGNHLMEANWLRNIARQARGDQVGELARAGRLFDWTVRNIQLDDYPSRLISLAVKKGVPLLPRDVLLFGHGDYVQRAWVFMLLARQENLNVVLLATPDKKQASGLRPWLPALLHDGKLYLFDTELGLPIPGPGGQGVATLDQVAADDALLRALDLPDDRYRFQAEDLQQVAVLIEGSPAYLSRRMEIVESRLAGTRRVALSVDASALARRLKGLDHVGEIGLWSHPYEVLREREKLTAAEFGPLRTEMMPYMIRFPTAQKSSDARRGPTQGEHPLFMSQETDKPAAADQAQLEYQACSLWMGRVLHFKGSYTGDRPLDGATTHYREVMVSDQQLKDVIDKFVAGLRFPDANIERAFREGLESAIPLATDHASYWLGLIAYERGNYAVAEDYFQKRTLERQPEGPWTYGARYNLARTYEAQAEQLANKPDEAEALRQQARELLEKDDSPQAHGNQLRARRLKQPTASENAAP